MWPPASPGGDGTEGQFRVNWIKQVKAEETVLTCRVRCSKILLVSCSLEKPVEEQPPSPPVLGSNLLTLSDTVPPSFSRALWSTFSLRLDTRGRDSLMS